VVYALDIYGYRQRKNKTSGTQGNHIFAPKIKLKFTKKIDCQINFSPFITFSVLNCRRFFPISLINPPYPCMIYHLKAIDLYIPKIPTTTTKEVIDK